MKGRFIVFEGTDGSGKATQVELLRRYLLKNKIPHKKVAFPRYNDNPYGKLIGRYLKGEFGGIDKVDNQLISLAFAGDRILAKPKIEKWLRYGNLVIADRYVSSNKAHMGARLEAKNRAEFIKWLDNLEYKINKIPKEDLVIFLHVPSEIAQKNIGWRGLGHDLHEKDLKHLRLSTQIYKKLAKQEKNWLIINCVKMEKMRPKKEIHQEIINGLKEKKFI